MTKKEEHKESTKEVKKPTEEVEEEEVEEEFPDSEFEDDEVVEGNKEMMILDETANKLIHKIETLDPDNKDNWDDLKELSKILKNIASAKKNLLKADLLGLELDDCLIDNIEEDQNKQEEPVEFEDEEIEEIEEPENKKDSKKHK